jgi:hypothetical protein
MTKKAKFNHPFVKWVPSHNNHTWMNACILNDVYVIQQWNDQKMITWTHAKTHAEWDHFKFL